MERLIDEEEDMIFETKLELLSIGTITFSKEIVSLLSVGVLKIKSIEEFYPKQRISDQTIVEVVPSTVKSKDFCVRLEVSLEEKVLPKTYYHHNKDDIQVDETLAKIYVHNL
jgi:hypothetical protein